MKRKRLTILITVDQLGLGGMERQIVELLKGLKQNNRFQVALAVLDHGGVLEDEAAGLAETVLSLRRRARFDVTPALALTWRAREAGVRLIHAFGWMSSAAGLFAARCLRIPVINGSVRSAASTLPIRERIGRWCALRSDAIVANSQAGLSAYGVADHSRAHVIYNGIDLMRFAGVVPAYQGDADVCMVANFSKYKDQATAIQAVPYIRQVYPQARLILVGHDFGTLNTNHSLVTELGLIDSICFVMNTTRPEPYIAGSRVCVLASHGEGISNSILEYMALGKPVVATDCGGNSEVIREGETGFLVPRGSPEALAERVIKLLKNPELARAMGEAGRQRVEEVFSLQRMVSDYAMLYDRLLNKVTSTRGRRDGEWNAEVS